MEEFQIGGGRLFGFYVAAIIPWNRTPVRLPLCSWVSFPEGIQRVALVFVPK